MNAFSLQFEAKGNFKALYIIVAFNHYQVKWDCNRPICDYAVIPHQTYTIKSINL